MEYGDRNLKILTDIEALTEAVNHGKLDVSLDIHGKRIVRVSVYGQKRIKYDVTDDAQKQSLLDVLNKIKTSLTAKEDTQVTFVVKISKNKVKDIFWHSTFEKVYDN